MDFITMLPWENEFVSQFLVNFYHSLPHVDITFKHVNSTFNPKSTVYLESLGVAASIPALWLLLTLLVLLTYLLSRCCDKQLRQGRSLYCHRWLLGITAFLCSVVVAVGLYGNDDMHNAIVQFSDNLHSIQQDIDVVSNESHSLTDILELQSQPLTDYLIGVVESKTQPNPATKQMSIQLLNGAKANITNSIKDLTLLHQSLASPSRLPSFNRILDVFEMHRWPITMALLSAFILICLILIFGVIRRVRCLLVMFAVLGLLTIIITWCSASIYLALAMAMGDICVDTTGAVETIVADQYGSAIADYYIHCPVDSDKKSGPLNTLILQAHLNIDESVRLVNQFSNISETSYSPKDPSLDKLHRSLNTAQRDLERLATLVDCTPTHRHYLNLTNITCHKAMLGLTFMLGSTLVAGLLFTILVWVDSHVWIYLRKRKGYLQVAEADPFLPLSSSGGSSSRGGGGVSTLNRANAAAQSYSSAGTYPGRHAHYRHTHTPPQTPPFPGTMNGRGGHHNTRQEQPPSAPPLLLGPNNGQYPTLSKSCKTLESSDFY